MAFYTGQKRHHIYKIDFFTKNGSMTTPGVAIFTTKKEADNFCKKSNKVAKKLKANRVAKYSKLVFAKVR